MKIALVAPVEEPVPPPKYGGIERVVHTLATHLVERGHHVLLFASGDSTSPAELVPVVPRSLRRTPAYEDPNEFKRRRAAAVEEVVRSLRREPPDVVHSHLDHLLLPFESSYNVPTLTTLHGPLDSGDERVETIRKFRHSSYVSVSFAQRVPLPGLNYLANIYNGVDLLRFPFAARHDGYLAFVGRMSPEKDPEVAIRAARTVGMRLVIAAKIALVDQDYFNRRIAPMIDGVAVQFLGELSESEKISLLEGAYALLHPSRWREPFGLAMIEAMACGTPVIAFNVGSAAEVVVHGVTGYVAESFEDFVEGIKAASLLDRRLCREHIERSFSSLRMASEYERLYEHVARG